jgi:DTW domain-containing protein YfiP
MLSDLRCPDCKVRKLYCFCAEIPDIRLQTRVLILMHTSEEVLPSNTARLVVKALSNSEIRIRGRKDRPMSAEGFFPDGRRSLLLYPSAHAAELNAEYVAGLREPVTLIVPDGNWRRTRKFVRRDPALVGIPHVKLPAGYPSEYRLRRQPDESGLCTLEAVARAVGLLESRDAQVRLEELLRVMVERTLLPRGGRRGDVCSFRGIE